MRAEQICMFDSLNEEVKITKPIRLIEFFAGYGSQNLGLKYIGANYESWKICEWATKSIQAYKDLHFGEDNTDYSLGMTWEEILEFLHKKGISADYNKPMEYSQIKRKGEKWCRTVYNNIIATDNLVNIQQVKGKDLNIIETDKYDYILTYSFPCQDLSLAGKGAGMIKDSGTRSSMLWEVGRILRECSKVGSLPQILLMENVTQVHSKKNKEMFDLWIKELDELGYTSYWEDMNAKNYGIPQNRNRTFMVSILRNWSCGEYKFPKGFPLTLRLKDLLEDEVDEKYYLSDKMIEYISSTGTGGYQNGDSRINLDVARPITAVVEDKPKLIGGIGEKKSNGGTQYFQQDRIYDSNSIAMCHPAKLPGGSYMYAVETKNKNIIPIYQNTKQLRETIEQNNYEEGQVLNMDLYNRSTYEKSQTLTSPTHNSQRLFDGLRIRKLTPRECWRLMGVQDSDFDKVSKNQSSSSLYHLSGDSIVTNVISSLFQSLMF